MVFDSLEQRLRALDAAHVWHPFAAMQAYRDENAPIIARGEGFHLIDIQGKRYLDGHSSLWCNLHGHQVPEIDAALRQQLGQISHSTLLGLSNIPSIELADALVKVAPPGLSKVFYSDNGATAVEIAVKQAYQYHRQKPNPDQRDTFVALSQAYHGDTVGTVSLGGIAVFHELFSKLTFPVTRVPSPVAVARPVGMEPDDYLAWCWEQLEATLRSQADRIAGVIIEPLCQAAAGIWVHPAGYLARLRELTRELGILLIADEVAVGFGRTGELFACTHEDVQPDFLCLSKGLTGGYLPLAATLTTDAIYNAFLGQPWEGKTFFHGHTYTGNPLGCVAALASLHLVQQPVFLNQARQNALTLSNRLKPLSSGRSRASNYIGEVRQCGTMVGIDLFQNPGTRERFSPQDRIGHRVTLACRQRSVIMRNIGDVVVLYPAPAMPTVMVQQLADTAIEAIEEVCAAT